MTAHRKTRTHPHKKPEPTIPLPALDDFLTPALKNPVVLGQHTAISIAKESGKWKKIPYLRENEGKLPPNLIVVGDRRRVLTAAKLLDEPLLLHERMQQLGGLNASGRVNIAMGIFQHKGKPIPLTVLETQMGCSAQDINSWEVLVNTSSEGYTFFGQSIETKGIGVIRAGTCAGITYGKDRRQAVPRIEIGDLINATSSLGDGAVVRQRLGCANALDPNDIRKFKLFWYLRGHGFTPDEKWPMIYSSPEIVRALTISCQQLGLTMHTGVNFTKESLYIESDEEWVKSLRAKYGALSTEMEHFGLAFLSQELISQGIIVHQGLISCVVGTVPGGSFATPGSEEEKKAKISETMMLKATMRALWEMTYGEKII